MLLTSQKYLVIFKEQDEQHLSSVFRALSNNMACWYDILRDALMCELESHSNNCGEYRCINSQGPNKQDRRKQKEFIYLLAAWQQFLPTDLPHTF
jgi:hypothetical protein